MKLIKRDDHFYLFDTDTPIIPVNDHYGYFKNGKFVGDPELNDANLKKTDDFVRLLATSEDLIDFSWASPGRELPDIE